MERPTDPPGNFAALSDIDLVRMLTVEAERYAADQLDGAAAEARRRGVPIDERFIPTSGVAPEEHVDGTTFAIGGATVRCTHCGGTSFYSREVLLNTRGLTFLKLDWLNRGATALVCTRCTAIQLFGAPPDAIDQT